MFVKLFLLLLVTATLAKELTFKHYIFEESCYSLFFEKNDFFNVPCLKLTLSKVLGYVLVWGAFAVKLPQIVKILNNKNIVGISFRAIALEAFMNSLLIGYNIYRGNPFSIYGENVFLGVENLIIMALFFIYPIKKDIPKYITYTVLLFALGLPVILQMVPGKVQEFSITLSIIVFILSRFDQIITNHQNKSTGNLAFLTNIMNFGGNLARTFTIVMEASDDLLLLASNVIPALTNGYIFLQFLMYWNNTVAQNKEVNKDAAKNTDAKKVKSQ